MPFNPMDAQQLEAARAIVSKIKANLAEREVLERSHDIQDANNPIERAYRRAQVAVDQAKRELAEVETALKDRESELLAIAAAEVDDAGKKKHTVDGAKGAAAVLKKTDEEYLLLKKSQAERKKALADAEVAFAEAKADQRALKREHELLLADKAYLAACVSAFAQFDAPAPQLAAAG